MPPGISEGHLRHLLGISPGWLMSVSNERTYQIRADVVDRLRKSLRMTRKSLADRCHVDSKTLRRWLSGKPAFPTNIEQLANALNTTPDRITVGSDWQPATGEDQTTEFAYAIQLRGQVATPEQAAALVELTPNILDWLKQQGVMIGTHQAALGFRKEDDIDQCYRVVSVVYGILESGGPFWMYVAIKPTAYPLFMRKALEIDYHHFDEWGEIIVSGDGKSPPLEVTQKVAEMYGVNAAREITPTHEKVMALAGTHKPCMLDDLQKKWDQEGA